MAYRLRYDTPEAVDAEEGEERRPQARGEALVPNEGDHGQRGERTERVELERFAEVPFGEGEHGAGQAAEGAGPAGEPAESADRQVGRSQEIGRA